MFCTMPASLAFLVDVMSYCLDLGPHGTPPHIQTANGCAVGPSVLPLGSWAPVHWHPPADAADLGIWMEVTLFGVTMDMYTLILFEIVWQSDLYNSFNCSRSKQHLTSLAWTYVEMIYLELGVGLHGFRTACSGIPSCEAMPGKTPKPKSLVVLVPKLHICKQRPSKGGLSWEYGIKQNRYKTSHGYLNGEHSWIGNSICFTFYPFKFLGVIPMGVLSNRALDMPTE